MRFVLGKSIFRYPGGSIDHRRVDRCCGSLGNMSSVLEGSVGADEACYDPQSWRGSNH